MTNEDDAIARIKGELLASIAPIIEDAAREIARRRLDDSIHMSTAEYAKHARVSEKTVRKWVKAGLPVLHRQGRIIRVKVAEADAWDPEGSTRHSAQMDAHGAKGR